MWYTLDLHVPAYQAERCDQAKAPFELLPQGVAVIVAYSNVMIRIALRMSHESNAFSSREKQQIREEDRDREGGESSTVVFVKSLCYKVWAARC
jgi:hypothetical protein